MMRTVKTKSKGSLTDNRYANSYQIVSLIAGSTDAQNTNLKERISD
jgi:hypothetical protein